MAFLTATVGVLTTERALLLLVVTALALAVTLFVRLRRRGKRQDEGARARLLARASLLGALRRGLGETYLVLGWDDMKPGSQVDALHTSGKLRSAEQVELESNLEPMISRNIEHVADDVDCLLVRKRDLSPVCAVALGDAPETQLSVPVVTLPLRRAYALQDVDAALAPLLNAPPETKVEPEAATPPAPPSSTHAPQRDAPRLPNALSTRA